MVPHCLRLAEVDVFWLAERFVARAADVDRASSVRSRFAHRRVAGLVLCLLLGMAGGAVHAETIRVFVSVLPLKHFVERVAGKLARVGVMVGPGQNPHTYEPSPKQMAELAKSKVYFRIGVPFEDVWLQRIAAANPLLQIVDLRKGVPLRPLDAETQAHRQPHPKQERHGRAGYSDPHIWTDPRRVQIIAGNIRDTLIALDPVHATEYESNFTEFTDALDSLDRAIRELFEDKAARRFMVFHPAWGYFAEAYRLRQIPIETSGKEPGARQLAHLIDSAKALGIRVIFVQAQSSRRNAETVARAIGGRVIAVDPLAENYSENLLFVAKTLAEVMK